MAMSAQHYEYWLQHEFEQTPAMRFGSLVHAIILGGEFRVFPAATRRANGWKDWQDENSGIDNRGHTRLLVTQSELENGHEAAHAIRHNLGQIQLKDGRSATVLLDGKREHSIDWSFRGRPARSTLDVLTEDSVVDLKTSTTAEINRFQSHAGRMLYHAQMAFYAAAYCASGWDGQAEPACRVIAAETKPPYSVTVHRLTDKALEKGMRCCVAWHEQLETCERSGVWPGYAQSEVDWDIPDDAEIDFSTEEEGE